MSRDQSGREHRREESDTDREAVGASRRGATSRPRNDAGVVAEGLAAAALVVGVFLFFVPEPVTSLLGAVLVVVGAAGLLGDAIGGRK